MRRTATLLSGLACFLCSRGQTNTPNPTVSSRRVAVLFLNWAGIGRYDLVNQYSKLCYRSSLNSLTKSSNDLEVGRPATAPPRPPPADPPISTKPPIATAPNGISRCKLPADKPFMVPRERSVRSINTNLQR